MAPSTAEHRRTHNLLLLNNLLNQSASGSPFTLILDSLEQSARTLVAEYIRRAVDAKIRLIFVAFETLARPQGVESFVQTWSSSDWQKQVSSEVSSSKQRTLLIFDNLGIEADLPALLSSFITPTVSLLAVYHTDVPTQTSHQPSALSLLSYLATTIINVHSLHHVLARKAARDRSLMEPSFGLEEGVNVLQGLGANSADIVIELEHRRKSGRGIKEWYVLKLGNKPNLSLLEDYPGYRVEEHKITDEVVSTFDLNLTDRQRQDREGVVLPYFDAQKGNEEGGRILYDMGSEDDFDEEEDEI